MDGRWRWRDLGRPEASLVGAQYVDWNHDEYPNRPFIAVATTHGALALPRHRPRTTASSFGVYGIEIDAARADVAGRNARCSHGSPTSFGPGKSAEMTYYTTPNGAKVFSAGVMNFGGSALWPQVRTMVANLMAHLSVP